MFVLRMKQRGFTPAIQILIDGKEVAGPFYTRLIKATVRDEAGQESDQVTFDLDDANNELEAPREKARIEVYLGYLETGLVPRGTYELQNIKFSSDEKGEVMTLQAKAADLRRALKGSNREAHENTTYGDIVRKLAKRSNLEAVIDPDLEKIKISYDLQSDQSDMDYLTRLSDEHNAIIKPAGGKMIAVKRGGGKSASGFELPPIIIRKQDCAAWNVEPDGRVEYGKVKGSYIDQKTGERVEEEFQTGLSGPDLILPDTYTDKDKARTAAEAETKRLNRKTGNGFFRTYGNPEAIAEATIQAEGFRDEINGNWRCASVEDSFDDKGYLTTHTIEATESGKKKKKKDEDDE